MFRINSLPKQYRTKTIKEKLEEICRQNNVVFMAMFGSFSRGQQTKKSDIDIAIKYKKGISKSLLDLIELEYNLKRIFGRKIDLGTYDSINPYVKGYVNKDLRIIYEER